MDTFGLLLQAFAMKYNLNSTKIYKKYSKDLLMMKEDEFKKLCADIEFSGDFDDLFETITNGEEEVPRSKIN